MHRSMILAALLAGLAAQVYAAAGTAATAIQAERKERSERQPATPTVSEGDLDRDGEKNQQRPQPFEPARPVSSTPTPQPIFIISCNASGCNDNQGRFLTRSGPQRLVGPDGISCQQMGGKWQCSPGLGR